MPDEYDKSEKKSGETEDESIHATAKKRWKICVEAWSKQATREKDDLAFQVPERQWDEGARRQRLGMAIEGVPTPARPVLSIPKLDQPIQMVLNQERSAHLGVSIQPLSADADKETSEILEGLYRRIERDSQAHLARSWAFNRAVKAGRGYYEITTAYDDSSDDPNDQVIRIERILHQESVYFDPSAQKPDFSDANYVFLASWVPLADFKAEFPDAKIPTNDEFQEDEVLEPEWIRGEGETLAVRVLKYYYKEKTYKRQEKGARKREQVEVDWCLMSGLEILDSGDWAGKYLPIVTVIGSELIPFDQERRWQGIIGPAKDAQRLYNYSASTAVELVALEPKSPWVGAEGQFEGYEAKWQQANIRNWPYLEYKPKTLNGELIGPPQRAQVDVGRLGPSMQLLQQADQFIQITTATYDPSLGRTSNREKSGRAIMALQQQGDEGNSHFMHNLAEVSMAYEAKCILDLIPTIYDREGRLARTLDEEDDSKTVMLNAPHFQHPETKMPMPAPGGQLPPGTPMLPAPPPQPGVPPTPPQSPPVKHYDLKKGIYSVAVSIGKTRQSALQEGAEEIGQILQSQPNLMPLIGPIYFKYRDFPGSKEIADLMAQVRDKQFPGLKTGDDGQPSAQQLQSQLQQMGQQMQMMQSQLQGAMEQIKTEQAKQQATIQTAQIKSQTDLQVAAMNNQTKLAIESLIAKFESMMKGQQMTHEAVQNDADRAHEALMSTAQQTAAAANKAADLTYKASANVPLESPPGGTEMAPGPGGGSI